MNCGSGRVMGNRGFRPNLFQFPVVLNGVFGFKDTPPSLQLSSQGSINFSFAALIGIVPKSIVTMTIINPTRMVQDRIEAHTVQRDALPDGGAGFFANIAKPGAADLVFGAGFGNAYRTAVALVDFLQHFAQGTVLGMLAA